MNIEQEVIPHLGGTKQLNAVGSEPTWDIIPLKTTLELRAGDATIDVYIARVPIKAANGILNALRSLVPDEGGIDLQHVRRFVKDQDLPAHLRLLFSGFQAEKSDISAQPGTIYHVAGPVSSIAEDLLRTLLSKALPVGYEWDEEIWTVAVPLLTPTSQEQALKWSLSHWPTVYKKSNPFGPHPSIVSRAEIEIKPDLHLWMDAASKVAAAAKSNGIGEAIGAVVVRRENGIAHAIAVAGDARWKQYQDDAGNVMAHSVLRVIGMVAQKLKAVESMKNAEEDESPLDRHEKSVFLDQPLLPEELEVFEKSNVSADGYLCHNLEIYLTHEPCVMCCMAILHSRFGRVIFGQRMQKTGGLCGETGICQDSEESLGLGYGLFWRKELNWSLLAWELGDDRTSLEVVSSIQA